MRVRSGGRPSLRKPTAVHEVAEIQDTPERVFFLVPTLGLGTIDHEVPFQDSTRVCSGVFLE